MLRFGACDVVFKPVTRYGLLAAYKRATSLRAWRTDGIAQPALAEPQAPPEAPQNEHELGVTIPLTGNYDFVQQHVGRNR